jgi:ParB-like chromosome segregation protein Spo0J
MRNNLQYRKIKDLKLLESNPRKISSDQMDKLVKSITDNPDYFEARPIILSDRTGELVIIAGNQRYKAAKKIGMKEVPTFLLSGLSEEREREIVIRDNVSNGEWDNDILRDEWGECPLEDWGVSVNWKAEEEPKEAKEDDFSEEDAEQAPAICQKGDIWQLGEHRLMCGDSTENQDVEKLVGGVR